MSNMTVTFHSKGFKRDRVLVRSCLQCTSVEGKIEPRVSRVTESSADLNPADCAIYPRRHTDWLWIFMSCSILIEQRRYRFSLLLHIYYVTFFQSSSY